MNRLNNGIFQPEVLDVDPTILDKNLQIVQSAVMEESLSSRPSLGSTKNNESSSHILLGEKETLSSIEVTPHPGMCVKTKNLSGKKVFLNLCKIQEIPPPKSITENQLKEIIANEDYESDFR